MLLAGIKDPQAFKTAEDILVEMGQYFQVVAGKGRWGRKTVERKMVVREAVQEMWRTVCRR